MKGQSFFAGKRVLVTGHTGFKGAWLCEWLLSLGADVFGYALAPFTTPNLFDALGLGNRLHHRTGDVRNGECLSQYLCEVDPTILFHLAAQPLVRYSYEHPVETYAVNVMGTLHLLEAVRRTKNLKSVVIVTSDKCYKNTGSIWGYRESDTLGGHDPYSSSKACVELLIASYRDSFWNHETARTVIASARAGNVVGGGDWADDRLIPDVVRSLLQKNPPVIRNPRATRPWQHVLEPLSGYLLLAQRLHEAGSQYARAWNFGPRIESLRTVDWIVRTIMETWGLAGEYALDPENQPHEAQALYLDSTQAWTALQWQPRWDLRTTLRRTIHWYREYQRDHRAARHLCQADIRAFEDAADDA